MSAEPYSLVEQDIKEPDGGNELPTYDDLANQNGPNSRFGRWRGWIEKRAAERYADVTGDERARRRQRGWGNEDGVRPPSGVPSTVSQPNAPDPAVPGNSLHIQTSSLSINDSPPLSPEDASSLPLPFVSEVIEPTHLKINHFGSRFLPHTTTQIRCILPVMGNRMLLVGHDDGLSVFDMFPQEWSDDGDIITKGPGDGHCWPIWIGETVYQMSLLEVEDNGSGTPQGVVLAIVGPPSDSGSALREAEVMRTARMYNLASLVSLARWTVAQKGAKPLNLHRVASLQAPSTPSKKHRQHGSIARGIKSLTHTQTAQHVESSPSYQNFLSPTSTTGSSFATGATPSERGSPPFRQDSDDSGWDMVEDLPLRWATDFVPLAAPGSRLAGTSVVGFATWSDETRKGKGTGGQLLAVATKNNILLYETPKGERAYRFVREFYTPLQPRNLEFVQQSGNDSHRISMEGASSGRPQGHKRTGSGGALKGVTSGASSGTPLRYGTHLSLFVIFDKKAGLIRLADSSVGEVELADDGGPPHLPGFGSGGSSSGLVHLRDSSSSSTLGLRQRARLSFEIRESATRWAVPVKCELPVPGFSSEQGVTQPVHILTRGKRTHVVPSPLFMKTSSYPPLHVVFWKSQPKHVSARVIHPPLDAINDPPILQLISFSETGIEVHETGLGFLHGGHKGKGHAVAQDVVRADGDLGETGFLMTGGNWDRLDQIFGPNVNGDSPSLPSGASTFSLDSMDSTDLLDFLRREEGVYGWQRKGLEDWRIFWVGGNQRKEPHAPLKVDYGQL